MTEKYPTTPPTIRSIGTTKSDPAEPTTLLAVRSAMIRSEIERAGATPDFARECDALRNRQTRRESTARASTGNALIEMHHRTAPILGAGPYTLSLVNRED